MLIVDAHLDLAWNAIDWNRDLMLPVEQIRARERALKFSEKGRCEGTVSFVELRKGNIGLFIATVLPRQYRGGTLSAVNRYESMTAAYAATRGQLAYYESMVEQGVLRAITDASSLHDHLKKWGKDGTDQPLGYILSMEGADSVLSPDQIEHWYRLGLRIIGPAHYGISPYAHGTGTVGGLFPPGKPLLKEMERVGMILDVTHLSDQCFDEALDIYGGPVLASHHNCRALVPDQRQLTDDQIRRLISRGAVIGSALDAWMMVPGWIRGETRPEKVGLKLEHLIDHIDHVCQLAGNHNHAAIGTDLDGGFGREQSPADLDSIADLRRLPSLMEKRGYKPDAIQAILNGNWIRFFTNAWSRD